MWGCEAQITPHKAKPQCGAREAQITPYKRSAVWGHLLLLIAALVFAACGNRHVSVKISGDIQDGGNAKLLLALVTADGLNFIDSTNLKDGHFEFKVSSDNELIKEREEAPMMFQLFLSDNNSLATMAKKGEKLKITADAKDLTQTYRISGGEEEDSERPNVNSIHRSLPSLQETGPSHWVPQNLPESTPQSLNPVLPNRECYLPRSSPAREWPLPTTPMSPHRHKLLTQALSPKYDFPPRKRTRI